MSTQLPDPEGLYAYEVHDSSDKKVGGKVEMVWVDEASGQAEFVGVNTNWLLKGKVHPIPLVGAELDENVIRVPFSEDQIKGSLDVGTDVELTPGLEEQIYTAYGLEHPSDVGPTSRPTGSGLDEDSIVMPGTFNALTGHAETLAESDEMDGTGMAAATTSVETSDTGTDEVTTLRRDLRDAGIGAASGDDVTAIPADAATGVRHSSMQYGAHRAQED